MTKVFTDRTARTDWRWLFAPYANEGEFGTMHTISEIWAQNY